MPKLHSARSLISQKKSTFVAIASLLMLSPGYAQDGQLQEMVITATRQDSELRNVPASVSVISRDDIQLGQQQLSLGESLAAVPGLFAQNQYNFTQDLRVSIRGAGSRANFGIRGIQIYVDGIPATTTDGQGGVDDIDLGSADSIQVIRGPVSALYGTASGGVIDIKTESGPETPFVQLSATQGAYGMSKYQLKTGGQSGQLNYLVNLSRLESDGHRDNMAVEHNMLNSRFNYSFNPDADLTLIYNLVDSPWAEDPGSITAALAESNPEGAWPANIAYDSGEGLDQQRLGLVYTQQVSATQKLTAYNFYLTRSFSTNLPFQAEGVSAFDRFFFGGGVKLDQLGSLFGMPTKTTVGIDTSGQRDERTRHDNLLGTRGPLVQDQNEDADAIGLFVLTDSQVTERLNLVLGLRYDTLTLAIEDKFLGDADQSSSVDFREFSPMVGATFALNDNLRLYSKYGTAFETPTFTELAGPGSDLAGAGVGLSGFDDIKSQQARSLELGLRGTTLAERLEFDVVVFNMQVENEVVNTATLGSRGVFQIADTARQGFEAMGVLALMEGLELTTSYTFSDFTFDSFPTSPAAEGNDLPLIPRHQIFAELDYRHASGFFAVLDVQWVDDYYANNANTATNEAYSVANLRIGHSFETNNLRIDPFLGIKNLTDADYNDNVRPNAFGGRFYEPAPERNIYGGANIRYNF